MCVDFGCSTNIEVLKEVTEGIGRQRSGMDFGCERLEESRQIVNRFILLDSTAMPEAYLSVKLRISMGNSSKLCGSFESWLPASASSALSTKTSTGACSSSSGSRLALSGSRTSDALGGPCRVLARLRDRGFLGVDSRRVNEREGWRFLGWSAMTVRWTWTSNGRKRVFGG